MKLNGYWIFSFWLQHTQLQHAIAFDGQYTGIGIQFWSPWTTNNHGASPCSLLQNSLGKNWVDGWVTFHRFISKLMPRKCLDYFRGFDCVTEETEQWIGYFITLEEREMGEMEIMRIDLEEKLRNCYIFMIHSLVVEIFSFSHKCVFGI